MKCNMQWKSVVPDLTHRQSADICRSLHATFLYKWRLYFNKTRYLLSQISSFVRFIQGEYIHVPTINKCNKTSTSTKLTRITLIKEGLVINVMKMGFPYIFTTRSTSSWKLMVYYSTWRYWSDVERIKRPGENLEHCHSLRIPTPWSGVLVMI